MTTISAVVAREILDSRGNPTVEADILIDSNFLGRASVPSGASCGKFEAYELRDNDNSRYRGKGVLTAVDNINTIIAPQIINQQYHDFQAFDEHLIKLDGSPNKNKLGANAILALSIAFIRALSLKFNTPLYQLLNSNGQQYQLPRIMVNVINGGAHANNNLKLQELMIVPNLGHFTQDLRAASEIFHYLGELYKKRQFSTAVGDEGGYAPNINQTCDGLDDIVAAINGAGYNTGNIQIAIDAAASELINDAGNYHIEANQPAKTTSELAGYYQELCQNYPIIAIEDAAAEEDFNTWQQLTNSLGKTITLVGDDLFVTNTSRLQLGIEQQLANAILIKPNQIGTVTQTLAAIKLAQQHQFQVVISHRSGETEDTFIAHLAVATQANFIKTGSICRGERIAKYNELLRIAAQL